MAPSVFLPSPATSLPMMAPVAAPTPVAIPVLLRISQEGQRVTTKAKGKVMCFMGRSGCQFLEYWCMERAISQSSDARQ